MDLQQKIENIIGTPLADRGYEIVRIQLSGQVRKTLQIMIERLDGVGVTVDDCAAVSRVTSVLLDQHDPISGAYTLEISSPGLARPLAKFKDFIRFQGNQVVIKTHQLIDGRKTFVGQLAGTNEKDMTIEVALAGIEEVLNVVIPFVDIKSARLHVDFDNLS